MIVRDVTGHERTWSWLRAVYGNGVQVHVDPSCEFELFEVWAMCDPTAGPSSELYGWGEIAPFPFKGEFAKANLESFDPGAVTVAHVADENGNPLPGIEVARWWPDDTLPNLGGGLGTWKPKGVHGQTNENGDVGFGMGGGDYYDPATGAGASWTWPFQGEALSGIGMIAGTSHWTLWPVFRRRGSPPPPPVDDIQAHLDNIIDEVEHIRALLVC